MQKSTPSFGRIMTMVLFALSCFALLLFLWLSFGGAIPLKPKGYSYKVALPEATQLGLEADVRIAGVTVGKVRKKEAAPNGNQLLATIEVERKAAPISRDSLAILRQKTLLGETYLEITPGTKAKLPEGGTLPARNVRPTVELDEIFQALDPITRRAFHTWQQSLAVGIEGRGQDLSDAFGNLDPFATDATAVLKVLNGDNNALGRLVKNTGEVFGAITQNEGQLRNLITNSATVFRATASQNDSLAETFRVFPTFLNESRRTMVRLQRFSADTRPLIRTLRPAARDLAPALRDVRLLAPDLRRLFNDLSPLITAARTGMPALRQTLRGLQPVLDNLGPFLEQLNPILQWFELYQHQVADFLVQLPNATADTQPVVTGGTGHYLRQLGPTGTEQLAMYPERLPVHRGNTYLGPFGPLPVEAMLKRIWPQWDCNNAGGEKPARGPNGQPNDRGEPACFVQGPLKFQGRSERFPHVDAADYSR